LITVQDVEKDNNIFEYNDNLDIIYENIYIKVTSVIYDINDTTKELGITIINFDNPLTGGETINFMHDYDKNILESNITKVVNICDLNILNNYKNLRELILRSDYDKIIGANVITQLASNTYFW
jgi:uncharacterized protein (UPF0210 family)